MLTQAGFEFAPSGYRSAALRAELSSTAIGGEFFSNLSARDILPTT